MDGSTGRQVNFRKALNGYNRDDVNSYIETVNREFFEAESGYKKMINSQKEQIASLGEALAEAQSRAAAQPSSEPESSAELFAANRKNEESSAVIVALNEALDKQKAELERLRADNVRLAQLNSESERNKTELGAVYEKAKMYDSMSSQVGNIIFVANNNADKLVLEASEKSERLKAETFEYLKSAIEDANTKLCSLADQYIGKFTGFADAAKRDIDKTMDEFRRSTSSINVLMENPVSLSGDAESFLKKAMSEMDADNGKL